MNKVELQEQLNVPLGIIISMQKGYMLAHYDYAIYLIDPEKGHQRLVTQLEFASLLQADIIVAGELQSNVQFYDLTEFGKQF